MTLEEKKNLKDAVLFAWDLFHLAQNELIEKHDGNEEIPEADKVVLNNFIEAMNKINLDLDVSDYSFAFINQE